MSPERRSDGGVPRVTRKFVGLPGRAAPVEQWTGANQAKAEKLRVKKLQRQAGAHGYQVRHSDYGYALIDTARNHVDGRNDLSLNEIASLLDAALKG